jgi:hypothetical protein
MNMTNATFQEASVYPKKYSREALLPAVGQHSRAIIPGDDPGDQQLPGAPSPNGKRIRTSKIPSATEQGINSTVSGI